MPRLLAAGVVAAVAVVHYAPAASDAPDSHPVPAVAVVG